MTSFLKPDKERERERAGSTKIGRQSERVMVPSSLVRIAIPLAFRCPSTRPGVELRSPVPFNSVCSTTKTSGRTPGTLSLSCPAPHRDIFFHGHDHGLTIPISNRCADRGMLRMKSRFGESPLQWFPPTLLCSTDRSADGRWSGGRLT